MGKIRHLRIKIIFIFGTVLILSLSVFSYLRINNLMRSAALVNHTNVVKLELETLFSEIKDAESAHRGYFLTRDKNFLSQFHTALTNVNGRVGSLELITNDNYSQRRNAIVLKMLIEKRAHYMEKLVEISETEEITAAQLITGRILMDNLRKQLDKMVGEEDFLLRIRTKSLTKESSITPLFTIFLIICSIVILIASYLGINRELKISNLLKVNLELRKKELLEANTFLEEKNKSLAVMNKELESFTYISSHDLQEPLRKIQTFITRITDSELENLSEKGRGYLSRTHDAASRMQVLIRDLLAYSRLNTEIFPIESVNLSDIVEEVKGDLDEEIIERNATIEVKGNPEVRIITSQFRQLLTNLISNSMKFSKPDVLPHIVIENSFAAENETPDGAPGQQYVKITITDNGIGFDSQYNIRIFEVFQRLHMLKDYPGTGIGLAIVKKIVENHHGFITAESELNEGAVFTIFLPA